MTSLRTFIAYVEDRPGVLNRVTSLFRRRAYNIQSLTVGRTDVEGISRLSVTVEADDDAARRIEANLYKLVDLLWVRDITHVPSVQRDLALVKVKVGAETRASLMQICSVFGAQVVDVSFDAMVLQITGTHQTLDGFLEAVRPLGVIEMVRTGMIAMTCGAQPAAPALEPTPAHAAA